MGQFLFPPGAGCGAGTLRIVCAIVGRVLAELSRSLAVFLEADVVPVGAGLSFEAPTSAWAEALDGAALNVYLADVREELESRAGDWSDVRDPSGRLLGRQPPVRRYAATYVVSAWGDDAAAQHAALGTVLAAAPAHDCIPDQHLTGALSEAGLSVRLVIGAMSDAPGFWGSFGHPVRPAVVLVATVPIRPALLTELAPPAESIELGLDARRGRPGHSPRTPPPEESSEAASTDAEGGPGAVPPAPQRWTSFRVRERIESD